ncbi:MAG: hypothetical protein JNG88_04125 [Phycisphaerales bacterium]|nr:hypothetical protein [Phycisphaerales bacterium]
MKRSLALRRARGWLSRVAIFACLRVVAAAEAQSTTLPVRELDPYLARQLTSTMKFLLLSTLLLLVFFVGAYLMVRFGRTVKKRAEKPAAPTPYIDAWSHYRISQDEIDRLTKDDATEREQPNRDSDGPRPAP